MASIDLNVDDDTVAAEDQIARMKLYRDGLLAESDWTQVPLTTRSATKQPGQRIGKH